MANSKANATAKRNGLIYLLVFLVPAIAIIMYGIIAKDTRIIPWILLYALVAALPGFFLSSKNIGFAAVVTSIVFILSMTGYIITDGMLYKSSVIKDKALVNVVSKALDKFPALVSQKDLEDVKVLYLTADVNYIEEANAYAVIEYTLSLGYDDAVDFLKKQEEDAKNEAEAEAEPEEADEADESDDTEKPAEPTINDYLKSGSVSVGELIQDYSELSLFKNVEYIIISGPNRDYLNYLSFYAQYYGFSIDGTNPFKDFKNLSFLENMTSLKNVSINNIGATDFSPLGKATSLNTLDIEYCIIEDASVLSALTSLEYLNMTYTFISEEINPDAEYADDAEVPMTAFDISFVASLVNLKELYLRANSITDISALKNLTKLTDLSFEVNNIENISVLSGLISLKTLNLAANKIKDASPIAKLTSLERISIGQNNIENASGLFALSSLKYIDVSENGLTELNGIENCKSLETLSVGTNEISDLSPLSGLTSLKTLSADSNVIVDLTPLATLKNLTGLSLKSNLIFDASPLKSLESLENLYIDENLITDLTVLSELEEAGVTVSGQDNQIDPNASEEDGEEGEENGDGESNEIETPVDNEGEESEENVETTEEPEAE